MVPALRSLAPGSLSAVFEIIPGRISDDRGYFSETYNERALAEGGISNRFVQDNESFSLRAGTVRGLHFQGEPFAQAKLIRVLRGVVFDVAVDIRRGSPSFGKHVSCTLSARTGNQVYVPEGFAHGFCTIEPETIVLYKVSAPYAKDCDFGLSWSDPALAIPWPIGYAEAFLSEKDRRQPLLRDLPTYFNYLEVPED